MNPDGPMVAALQFGVIGLAVIVFFLAIGIIVTIGIVCIVLAIRSRRKRHRRRH